MCRRTSTKDPLRRPPNTSRRDKSREKCLQGIICLCLLYTSYLKMLCRSHVSYSCLSVHQMDPRQDPHLRNHVSASLCLRLLCKIHVCGSMCPAHVLASTDMDPLQDPCLRIHVSASLYLRIFRILYKVHVFGFMSQHPLIWSLYKIHVFGFMSQHLCISGSSARSMSRDSCLSIHMYLRILCKIHVSGSINQHPYVSQDPLQDPRLRIHVSASLYLTDSLQDPRLRIHVSASLNLRILCKIHVSGFMSQHLCISGFSTRPRSMSSDSCLSIKQIHRIGDPSHLELQWIGVRQAPAEAKGIPDAREGLWQGLNRHSGGPLVRGQILAVNCMIQQNGAVQGSLVSENYSCKISISSWLCHLNSGEQGAAHHWSGFIRIFNDLQTSRSIS